jgi:membrane protein implicated in regulation of membrane protease activity
VAVFVVASLASLLFLRPIARRHMRMPGVLRTGTAALVGQRALVIQRVDQDQGQVRIGGEVWTARPFDETDVFEPGERVDVMKIDGATALVAE